LKKEFAIRIPGRNGPVLFFRIEGLRIEESGKVPKYLSGKQFRVSGFEEMRLQYRGRHCEPAAGGRGNLFFGFFLLLTADG